MNTPLQDSASPIMTDQFTRLEEQLQGITGDLLQLCAQYRARADLVPLIGKLFLNQELNAPEQALAEELQACTRERFALPVTQLHHHHRQLLTAAWEHIFGPRSLLTNPLDSWDDEDTLQLFSPGPQPVPFVEKMLPLLQAYRIFGATDPVELTDSGAIVTADDDFFTATLRTMRSVYIRAVRELNTLTQDGKGNPRMPLGDLLTEYGALLGLLVITHDDYFGEQCLLGPDAEAFYGYSFLTDPEFNCLMAFATERPSGRSFTMFLSDEFFILNGRRHDYGQIKSLELKRGVLRIDGSRIETGLAEMSVLLYHLIRKIQAAHMG